MSGIIRVKKDSRYFVASNEPFNDKRLTWEARGIMGYLLSKPDGWECHNYDLINKGPAGDYIIKRVMKELQEYGYINRFRVSNGKNKIRWITEVYESPSLNPKFSKGDFSTVEDSTDELSTVEKLGDKVSTESSNTNSINTDPKPQENFDYGDHIITHQPGQETVAHPDDFQKHFGYRDEVLRIYNTVTGLAPNPSRKDALIQLAQDPRFNPDSFEEYLTDYNNAGGNSYDVNRLTNAFWLWLDGLPIRDAMYPDKAKTNGKHSGPNIIRRNGKNVLVIN